MDKESLELVKEAYHEAKKILSLNRVHLIKIAELLQKNTTIYNKDMPFF